MEKFFLLMALILSFAFDANAGDDTTSVVMFRIIKYIKGLGGPIITVVIIGTALLAIFGRMPWPALFALCVFTAVFFGANKIVEVIVPSDMWRSFFLINMDRC
jgi:type IV secretory pathway VirB2 component (pilin)